jgi:2-dehydropantoate 2-reductase
MRVLILGAGAIGGYLGVSLAQAGHTVTYLARPATAAHLRAHGLRLTQGDRQSVIAQPNIVESATSAFSEPHDVLVFALKSFDTASALTELRATTDSPPPILCLQNGVDNESEIARVFGAERVIAGTVTTAVGKRGLADFVVERQRGVGVALGQPLSERLLAALNEAGLNARGYRSEKALKWSKLLTNLVGNATSAILDLTVAEVFADARLFALEQAQLRECLRVMQALNADVVDLPGTPVRALALGAQLPAWLARPLLRRGLASARGSKMPSLHIDLHGGRQTEVRWLHGAVAHHGAACGVATPVNRGLAETVDALTAGRLKPEDFQHRPDALLRLIKP